MGSRHDESALHPSQRANPPKRGRPTIEDKRVPLGGVRVRASVTARLQRLLIEAEANGTYPYRSRSQLVEDLIVRGMGTLKGEVVEESMQYLRAVNATDAIGVHRREAQAAFSRIKVELTELLEIHAVEQAQHYYWSTLHAFEEMSPNIWRDWLLEQLPKTFPKLAGSRPKGVPLDSERPKRPAASKKTRR